MGKFDALKEGEQLVSTSIDSNEMEPVKKTFKRDVLAVLAPGLYVMSSRYGKHDDDKYSQIEIVHAKSLEAAKFEIKAKPVV